MMAKTKGKIDGPTGVYCYNTSELYAAIGTGKAAGMAIISKLGYRTIYVRWVPKMLNVAPLPPKKRPREDSCAELCQLSRDSRDAFLQGLLVMKPGFITTTTNEKAINGIASPSVATLQKIQSGLLQLKSWLASSGTVTE